MALYSGSLGVSKLVKIQGLLFLAKNGIFDSTEDPERFFIITFCLFHKETRSDQCVAAEDNFKTDNETNCQR